MRYPKTRPAVDAKSPLELYGKGYFHGENSGYPAEGYALHHPDWSAWLDVLQILKPSGVFLDIGCAYGYLVNEARRRSYCAFGLDVSHFALHQEPAFRPWLMEARGSALPFATHSADVITVFDVLEHLDHPGDCLAEIRRVLKPDGILAGATPDPIYFDRVEETHFSERPPSFWARLLEDLGFHVRFRFSNELYNFQFLATPSANPAASKLDILQHDYFSPQSTEVLHVQPSDGVAVVLRSGWGPLSPQGRPISSYPASIYLLNSGRVPLALRLELRFSHTTDFSTLRLRFNSYVITEIDLDSEQTERVIHVDGLVLPSGGHHLFLDLAPGGPQVTVQSISIEASASTRSALVRALPFDLYQRYRLCSDIVKVLRPKSVLDAGGYLGDEHGHLAVSHDFFQTDGSSSPEVTVTDVRQCDHPDYLRASAWEQPFDDQSFDLVLSLDVLEHLPESERPRFLSELDRLSRQWILLGAPFSSPEIEKAETRLADSLMGTRRFLQEHRELGLPELAAVQGFYLSKGYTVSTFPNGYLPAWLYWQVTSQHYFGLNDYDLIREYNSLYSAVSYPSDNREPAYRHILLVAKSGITPSVKSELAGLLSNSSEGNSPLEKLALDPSFIELHERAAALLEKRRKSLTDAQFLINERHKLIELLRLEQETPLWHQILRRVRRRF